MELSFKDCPIGYTFYIESGNKIVCVKSPTNTCKECIGLESAEHCSAMPLCTSEYRKDNNDVIFVKVD